jgi:hypothetical protein
LEALENVSWFHLISQQSNWWYHFRSKWGLIVERLSLQHLYPSTISPSRIFKGWLPWCLLNPFI